MLMFVQGTCRILLNIDNVGREPFERVIVSATKLKGFRTTFKSFWCRLNISEKEKLVESLLFSVYFAYHLNYLHTCNSTKICAGDKNCKRESVERKSWSRKKHRTIRSTKVVGRMLIKKWSTRDVMQRWKSLGWKTSGCTCKTCSLCHWV